MKKKSEKKTEPFWEAEVKVYFDFCIENLNYEPEFTGTPNPRFLKEIVESLKRRAEKNNIEWTEEVACKRLQSFFKHALDHDLLKKCFTLKTINLHKDLVFQKLANNGKRVQTDKSDSSQIGKPGREYAAL